MKSICEYPKIQMRVLLFQELCYTLLLLKTWNVMQQLYGLYVLCTFITASDHCLLQHRKEQCKQWERIQVWCNMGKTQFSFVGELFAQNNDNFIQQLSYFSVTWIPLCGPWHLSGPVLTGRRQQVTFSFSLSPFFCCCFLVGDILFKYLSWFLNTSRNRFLFYLILWFFQLKLIIVREINQTSDIMKAWPWERKKNLFADYILIMV